MGYNLCTSPCTLLQNLNNVIKKNIDKYVLCVKYRCTQTIFDKKKKKNHILPLNKIL